MQGQQVLYLFLPRLSQPSRFDDQTDKSPFIITLFSDWMICINHEAPLINQEHVIFRPSFRSSLSSVHCIYTLSAKLEENSHDVACLDSATFWCHRTKS